MPIIYIRKSFILTSLLFCSLLFSLLHAQQNFNHFQTLFSQGTIPTDFTLATSAKIQDDIAAKRTDLSVSKEKVFLEGIHYSIDRLLHSGSVIYGDEVSLYVEAVAKNLLRDEPELLSQLRFYTIKSNETNALSTDQGIVFVTTGLISQLTSEAQLAYILSHEIAHFTEKHVAETFDWKSKNKYEASRIEQLSSYSQEHEFEADKLALKRYHKAGYSDHEIEGTFDVLMYSYLPFDEVEVPNSYFSTENFYIPDSYFATKKYPIKAEEDYNDSRSSHPNIKKRKEAVLEGATDFANWGTTLFSQGESTFYYIRNLARFERIRTDLIDAEFGKALYSIFLLEREFPESVYLKRMKAHAWLGLTELKAVGRENNTIRTMSDYEGESAAFYFFLKKLNRDGITSFSMRTIYDLRKQLPEDVVIKAIMDRFIEVLNGDESFDWSEYSDKSFVTISTLNRDKSLAKKAEESADTKAEVQQSKYDKIKTKKSVSIIESFDSTKFYFYGLSDLVLDSNFQVYYKSTADKWEKRVDQKIEFENTVTYTSTTAPYAMIRPMKFDSCIVVQPSAIYLTKTGINWTQSEKCEKMLTDALVVSTAKKRINMQLIHQQQFDSLGTERFNERNLLYNLLKQSASVPEASCLPVDYELLVELRDKLGTSNVIYSGVEYYYERKKIWPYLIFPLTMPFALLYAPINAAKGHHTQTSFLVLDLVTGELKTTFFLEYNAVPNKAKFTTINNTIFKKLKPIK